MSNRKVILAALAAALCGISHAQDSKLSRGRYMVLTGHCNNCHTAGYAQKEGNVAESAWLTGSGAQGWRGPWGTTYASNLRINVNAMGESDWVAYLKNLKQVAWRFRTDSLGPRPEYKLEGTPLMVKGMIYATAGTRRIWPTSTAAITPPIPIEAVATRMPVIDPEPRPWPSIA